LASARPNTMVLVDGGWGVGGNVLTREMLSEDDAAE